MEKKHLISAGWLVLPLATFALGWGLKPTAAPLEQNDPGAQSSSHRGSTAGGAGSRAPGGRSGGGSGSAPGQAGRLGTTEVGSGKPLSTAQIKMLGQEFRSTLDPIKRRAAFLKLLDGITIENARTMREEISDLDHNDPAFRDFHYAWGKIGGVDAIMHGADTKKPDMGATLAGWASAERSCRRKGRKPQPRGPPPCPKGRCEMQRWGTLPRTLSVRIRKRPRNGQANSAVNRKAIA